MNNQNFANLGFLAIAVAFGPMTFFKTFEHKSARDYRKRYSLTKENQRLDKIYGPLDNTSQSHGKGHH